MNVASLELYKELYKLSGWHDTFGWYSSGDKVEFEGKAGWEDAVYENTMKYDWSTDIPAYDLGYLLRKLPVRVNGGKYSLVIYKGWHNGKSCEWYTYGYQHINKFGVSLPTDDTSYFITEADTPEDAACKLAIQLFKQGVLTKAA